MKIYKLTLTKILAFFLLLGFLLSYIIPTPYTYGLNSKGFVQRKILKWPTAALPTSVVSGNATVVSLSMGSKNNVLNRFWQLFTYDQDLHKWQNIVGNIGVATNGGFSVVSDENNQFLLAVFPAILLRFSPVDILKITTAKKVATSYVALPPMTQALSHSLSNITQINSSTFMSAVQTPTGSYPEVTSTSSAVWHKVSLFSSNKSNCRPDNISSLFNANNFLLFGTDCIVSDYQSPIFYGAHIQNAVKALQIKSIEVSFKNIVPHRYVSHTLTSDTVLWEPLAKSLSTQTTTFAGGLAVVSSAGKYTSPVGLYTFGVSETKSIENRNVVLHTKANSFLSLPLFANIISLGSYGTSGYFVLVKYPNKKTYLFLERSLGTKWVEIAGLPHAVQTIATLSSGVIQAFSVSGNILHIYNYAKDKWLLTQTIEVPIQYGSSS
jgi:hypothetical protein